jgi:hypothetical protein
VKNQFLQSLAVAVAVLVLCAKVCLIDKIILALPDRWRMVEPRAKELLPGNAKLNPDSENRKRFQATPNKQESFG